MNQHSTKKTNETEQQPYEMKGSKLKRALQAINLTGFKVEVQQQLKAIAVLTYSDDLMQPGIKGATQLAVELLGNGEFIPTTAEQMLQGFHGQHVSSSALYNKLREQKRDLLAKKIAINFAGEKFLQDYFQTKTKQAHFSDVLGAGSPLIANPTTSKNEVIYPNKKTLAALVQEALDNGNTRNEACDWLIKNCDKSIKDDFNFQQEENQQEENQNLSCNIM